MSIFGKIMGAIFGGSATATPEDWSRGCRRCERVGSA